MNSRAMRNGVTALVALVTMGALAAPAAAKPGDVRLLNGKPLHADASPAGGTGYTFDLTSLTRRWTVVAVQPTAGRDVDLDLYTDGPNGQFIGSSIRGISLPDFVAMNDAVGQNRPYRAVVSPYGTSAPYAITWSTATTVTSPSWTAYAITSDENVHVHDLVVGAGQCVGIGVWGTTHNIGEVYVFLGNRDVPRVVTPLSPVAAGFTYKPGDHTDYYDATFAYLRPAQSTRYGVVIVNRNDGTGYSAQYEIVPIDGSVCPI